MRLPKIHFRNAAAGEFGNRLRNMANVIRSNKPGCCAPAFDGKRFFARLPKPDSGAWRKGTDRAKALRKSVCSAKMASAFRKLARSARPTCRIT